MVRAILITHGMLGAELLKVAGRLYGVPDGVAALTNEGRSGDDLVRHLHESLGPGSDPIFVFLDMPGGSCLLAALSVAARDERIIVVTGVNLPMLLEFLHHRDTVSVEELLERVLSRGRDAVTRK